MKRRKCTRRIGQNWIPNSGVCERSNNQRDTVTQSIVIVSPRYRYQSSSSYLSRLGKTKGRESKKKGPDPVTISNFLSATTVTISRHMLRSLPFLSFTDIDYCLYRYLPNSSPIFLFFFDRFTFSSHSFVFYGSNKGTRTGGEQLPRDTIGSFHFRKKSTFTYHR